MISTLAKHNTLLAGTAVTHLLYLRLFLFAVACTLSHINHNAFVCHAHPGGLDSSGGHNDRKNGGYHYHRRTLDPTPKPIAPSPRASRSSHLRRPSVRRPSSNSLLQSDRATTKTPRPDTHLKEDPLLPATSAEALLDDTPREWSDNNNKFSTNAVLVAYVGDKVLLRLSDSGKVAVVRVARLSREDQEYLKGVQERMFLSHGAKQSQLKD